LGSGASELSEVKTISPEKTSDYVRPSQLREAADHPHLARLPIPGKVIDRSELSGGAGKYLKGRLPRRFIGMRPNKVQAWSSIAAASAPVRLERRSPREKYSAWQ